MVLSSPSPTKLFAMALKSSGLIPERAWGILAKVWPVHNNPYMQGPSPGRGCSVPLRSWMKGTPLICSDWPPLMSLFMEGMWCLWSGGGHYFTPLGPLSEDNNNHPDS